MRRMTIAAAVLGMLAGIGGCAKKAKPAALKPQAFAPAPQRPVVETPAQPGNGASEAAAAQPGVGAPPADASLASHSSQIGRASCRGRV